jgi:hypothetical protein
MNYGRCQGGPYDGRQIAHPESVMRVAIDKVTKRVDPAVIAGSGFEFGAYRWDGKLWQWSKPSS